MREVLFSDFVKLCKRLRQASSVLEKRNLIASFLTRIDRRDWKPLIMLLSGKAIPESLEGGLGLGFSLVNRALSMSVRPLIPLSKPTVREVYEELIRISKIKGSHAQDKKVEALASLLSRLNDEEKKWLIKIIFGELRIGVVDGHILASLADVLNTPLELIRRAYLLRGDLSELIDLINSSEDLKNVKPIIFKPVKPMLATPADSIVEAYSMIGGGEAAVEVKYDGARVQIHIKDGRVKIFSRRLTDVTSSLPDIVSIVRNSIKADEAILEGEVIAIDESEKPLPFQDLMKRFRRVKELHKIIKEIPARLYLFDIIYLDGKLLIDEQYVKRYEVLSSIVPCGLLAERIVTSNINEAENFFRKAIEKGHEGVMVKRLDAPYILGSRGKYWIKVKTAEYVDLVIVGAEWGHGRRSGWLSDYYLAAYNPETGNFEIVGKTFKGLTDEEFQYMTKALLEDMIRDEGFRIWVKPRIVVEVAFNEIQRSPKYKSGLALRLARIIRIREDKDPYEATTIQELYQMYKKQFEYKGSLES